MPWESIPLRPVGAVREPPAPLQPKSLPKSPVVVGVEGRVLVYQVHAAAVHPPENVQIVTGPQRAVGKVRLGQKLQSLSVIMFFWHGDFLARIRPGRLHGIQRQHPWAHLGHRP